MKQLKKILTVMLLLLSTIGAKASNEGNVLIVEMKDGKSMHFLLSEKPVVTFDSETLFVTSHSFTTTLAHVSKMFFLDDVAAHVEDAQPLGADNVFKLVFVDGNTVLLSGLSSASTTIMVRSIDGKVVPSAIDRQGTQQAVIRLHHCPQGFYIIQCDKHTFKIYKK